MRLMLPVEVDDQLLADILITAVEGGSDYWAHYTNLQYEDGNLVSVVVSEEEPSFDDTCRSATVTPHDLAGAIESLASRTCNQGANYPQYPYRHIQRVIEGDVDAETADVILQIAVLGEVVYG